MERKVANMCNIFMNEEHEKNYNLLLKEFDSQTNGNWRIIYSNSRIAAFVYMMSSKNFLELKNSILKCFDKNLQLKHLDKVDYLINSRCSGSQKMMVKLCLSFLHSTRDLEVPTLELFERLDDYNSTMCLNALKIYFNIK